MSDKFAFNPKLTLGYGRTYEDSHIQLFGIENEGKSVGSVYANITKDDPTNIHINNIETEGGQHQLGPRHVRSLAKQLKVYYPKTESISGARITGARKGQPRAAQSVKVKI